MQFPTLRQLFDSTTSTYTYLLADADTKEGIIIDPVYEQFDRDMAEIKYLDIQLKWILETHVHADHITGADLLREKTGAKVGLGKFTKVNCADHLFEEDETISFGSFKLKAISTPGHTNGCTSYLFENRMVFTGDALLIHGCGRTDFQEGSSELLFQSIREKLFSLPDSVQVYPAHDYQGRTHSTIADEKKSNPRLKLTNTKEDFIKIMAELKLDPPKNIHVAVPANVNCGKV